MRYAGAISGTVEAHGDLKAPRTSALTAQTRLRITPAGPGTPLSGKIDVDYEGRSGGILLRDSFLGLPSSRIGFSGEFAKQAQVRVTSQNLEDFGPVLSFLSSSQQQPTFPIKGGKASLVSELRGPMDALQISGQANAMNFVVGQRPFDKLAVDFQASPSALSVENGSLSRNGFQALFSARVGLRNWGTEPRQPVAGNLMIRDGDLADVLALAEQAEPRARGLLNADARIAGTFANPLGNVQLTVVNGTMYDEPFDRIQVTADLTDQLVNLRSAEVTAGMARVEIHGTLQHQRDSFETGRIQLRTASSQIQLSQFQTLQKQRPGLTGLVQFDADVTGDLANSNGLEFVPALVNANLNATGVRDHNQNYGNLAATVRTEGSAVDARLTSDFAGSNIQVTSRTQLARDHATTADAFIRNLGVERALSIAQLESQVRARGTLTANAHLTGTLDDPHANVTFDVVNAVIEDEPLTRLAGSAEYTNDSIKLPRFDVNSPGGSAELSASFSHARGNYRDGHLDARLTGSDIDLGCIREVQKRKPGMNGRVRMTADVSTEIRDQGGQMEFLPARADVNGSATRLEWNGRALGDASVRAETNQSLLTAKIDSNFGGSSIQGTAEIQLRDDYPTKANITFAKVTYSGLQPFLAQTTIRPGFDVLLEGRANAMGAATNLKGFRGDLELSRAELSSPPPGRTPNAPNVVRLQNQGPIVGRFENSQLQVQTAHLTGSSTDITLAGAVPLDSQGSMNLTLNGKADLALLNEFDPSVFSSGGIVLNASARGTIANPQVNGRIALNKASVGSADWPNGISNANGEILLSGSNLTITSLTAESGGGKVSADGFATLSGPAAAFNLRVNGKQVRTRYAGLSMVTDSALTLTGNSERSVLGGTVTIGRLSYNQQSDIGSILASRPAPTPTPPSGILGGMRFNVRIQTAPNARVQTTLAEGLSANADLTLLGRIDSPGMVGRVGINSGALIFFGNKYAVNRGAISFFNGNKIEPILDIDLETAAKSVSVILSVAGPVDNLKLTYRSDPPLKFEDIVALLATGKTPPDATIAAHQPADPQLSFGQMGESAILSQGVANPLANRMQRVFGVSQLRIDPTFNSGSVLPQARVTLQQQVTGSITFTYTQDLTQTNSQILRVEWAVTPRFSAVATRDENGIFGLDFLYKKQFR